MTENKLDYWDWVSSQDILDYSDKETLRTLIKECDNLVCNYLNNIHWIGANIIYLNYIFDIPQKEITKYIDISQLGVSKRLRTSLRKLKIVFSVPEQDIEKVKEFYITRGFNQSEIQIITLIHRFYSTKIVSQICNMKKNNVTIFIKEIIEKLSNKGELEDKYINFYNQIIENETIGDYMFKKDDKERVFI